MTTLSPGLAWSDDQASHSSTLDYQEHLHRLRESILKRFRRTLRFHDLFHVTAAVLGCSALTFVGLAYGFLLRSAALGLTLSGILLGAFGYYVLKAYLASRKPQQLQELCDLYLESCRSLLNTQEAIGDTYSALAAAACQLAGRLEAEEYRLYRPPRGFQRFGTALERLSAFSHWADVLRMREKLLSFAIKQHIEMVKGEPTSLDVHAALANAYVLLSSLYVDPRRRSDYEGSEYIPPGRVSEEMEERFRATAERAIEEFKILKAYAPDDPWVHAQLAYSYHDLQMPMEEIREYEIMLRLRPNDLDTLYKLGTLYFEQGMNSKGLKVYEQLRRRHYKRAEKLLAAYGSIQLPWET